MMRSPLLPRLLALAAIISTPFGLAAQDVSAASTPATAEEVAYWRDLQAEITALRAANAALPQSLIEMSVTQLDEAMERVEAFLENRDDEADDVADFGEDLRDYHKNLVGLFEAVVPALNEAASFHQQANRANPMARMMAGAKAVNLMSAAEDFKPTLRDLHEQITARMVAAGGPNIFFFQGLALSDKSYVSTRGLSPLERDRLFIEESTAIDPGLGAIAEHYFVPKRKDGRSESEITAIRDKMLELMQEITATLGSMSNIQIENEIPAVAENPNLDAVDRGRLGFVLRQELLRRHRDTDAAFRLIDWKAAFARWFGNASANPADLVCNDLSVSPDGLHYAYTTDSHTATVRLVADDTIVATQHFDGAIRGLDFDYRGRLMLFTTQGLFRWDPTSDAEPYLRDKTTSPNITGAIATATQADRFFQAWANIPGITRGDSDSKLAGMSSSNITAAAISADGSVVAMGYSGADNLGNGEKSRWGVTVLGLPEELTPDTKFVAKFYTQQFVGSVTAIAFDADASHLAFTIDRGEVLVVDRTDEEAPTFINLTIDSQPYTAVAFVPGEAPLVLAAANNGVIRIWNYETKQLVQRFEVPTGPAGIVAAIHGDQLITAALGGEAVHRWSLQDGAHLKTVSGADPTLVTPEVAAQALAAEQELRPAIDALTEYWKHEDGDAREAYARKQLATHGELFDRLGRRQSLVNAAANNIADRLRELNKAKDYSTTVKLGQEAIAEGFSTMSIYYSTVTALLNTNQLEESNRLLEEGLQVYPSSSDLRYLYQWRRMQSARRAGNLEATLAAIDEIDLIRPEDRPNTPLRIDAYTQIAYQKTQAGQKRAALDLNLKALDVCRTKEQQLDILPNAFALAYELKDWKLTVGIANMWMQVDPNKKNDQQFLEWARYAYSQMPK